jgi:hypothetical protein
MATAVSHPRLATKLTVCTTRLDVAEKDLVRLVGNEAACLSDSVGIWGEPSPDEQRPFL